VFPSMTLASLEAFSCEQIGSQKYLSADLEELCPTPDDASYWFSVLMTAFWVVGTPVFTLWSMIYHKVPHMANQKLKESVVNQMISEYSAHAVDPSRRKLANSLGKRVRTMETVSEEDPEFQRRIEDLHQTIFPDCNGYGLPKLCAAVLKRALSFREASGLRWDDVGTQAPQGGTELDHASLSEALSQRKTFTEQEWMSFRIQNLQMNHFIKSGDSYYRPANGVSASRNRLTFADLQKALRKWFEDMDINVNSYLDATELQLEFEHLGMGDAETASIFISSFDVDKNGHLDLEEFEKGMMHILDNSIPGVGSADLVLLFSSFSEIESDRPVSLERFASFGRRLCEKAFVFSGAERAASATAQQLLVLLNYPWKRRGMEAGEAEVDDKIETEMEMPNTVPLQKSNANKPSTKFEATSYGVEKYKDYEGFLELCKILSRNIGVTSTDDDMDKATVFDLPVLFDQILQALDKLLPASPIEAAADRETDNIFKLRGKVMKSKENFKEMLRGDVENLGLKLMDEGVIRPPPLEWDGSLGTDEVKAIERLGFLLDAYQVSVWYWEVVEMTRKLILSSLLVVAYNGTAPQMVGSLITTFVFLLAHLQVHPYLNRHLNDFQRLSLITQFFTIFGAIIFLLMQTLNELNEVRPSPEDQVLNEMLAVFILAINWFTGFFFPVFRIVLMVMKSDFSLSVTMVKFYNQLIRCTCLTARNQDLHNLSSEFMEKEVVQWQESARRLLQPGLQPNQSGGLALREPARPEEAALPRQDTIYLEQDDDIQDAIPPTATSMQEHSSSVTGEIVMKSARDEAGINPIQVPVTVSRQDTIYQEQNDGIQDAIPPATGQARTSMQAQSSSVKGEIVMRSATDEAGRVMKPPLINFAQVPVQLPETFAPGTSTGVSSGPILLVEELQASTEEVIDLHMVEDVNMMEAILRSEQDVSAPQTASRRLPREHPDAASFFA